jgi:CubicO group peptidase (beta-lactamase class C family)
MPIDGLVREYFPHDDEPGAGILVSRGSELVFCRGYGLADMTTSTPVTPETNFRLASVSKQFTAMAILMLCEDGKLSLDDRLTSVFPDFPEYGTSITVRHLLNHTSGLRDYEDLMTSGQAEQVLDHDVLELMRKASGPDFPAGTRYSYSNSGYAVLAMIIERVSGQRFADFLHQRIFEPLGMHGSVAYEKGVSEVVRRAMGYRDESGVFRDADQSPTSAVLGDGGIYTSVADYRKWDAALYSERLVPRPRLEEAFRPGPLCDDRQTTYGFGWMLGEHDGHKVVFHTGDTCGFNTCVRRIPDLGLLVVVLSNRRGDQAKRLAVEIENLLVSQ